MDRQQLMISYPQIIKILQSINVHLYVPNGLTANVSIKRNMVFKQKGSFTRKSIIPITNIRVMGMM